MSAPAAATAAPADFRRRSLAWAVDFALLSPPIAWLAWPPLRRALAAGADWLTQVQGWMLERVLAAGSAGSPFDLARQLLDDPVQGALARAQVAQLSSALLGAGAIAGVIAALYFVAFEASAWQATPGKRLLGLRVEGLDGRRLSPARALARHVAGAASWLTLNVGHLLAALRPDRRALHDLIAGTRVIARGPMPAWGRLAFAILVALAVLAPVWLVGAALARLAAV